MNKFDKKHPYESLGNNTGNIAFWSSIVHLFEPDCFNHSFKNKGISLEEYDAIFITDLIWIRENQDFSYLQKLIEGLENKIVFLSVGLQSSCYNDNFKIHPSVINILKAVSKYKVIGVRGKYTAKILKKYGIVNTQVIGCPSMYYWNNPDLKVQLNDQMPLVTISNFRAVYGKLSTSEHVILETIIKSKLPIIEQNDTDYTLNESLTKLEIDFLKNNTQVYFNDYSWIKSIWSNSFSFGLRFHANVMALRAGIPSLFITIDSRTKEMTDFFKLPSIDINDIKSATTVSDLYRLMDYSAFNKNYKTIFKNFTRFLSKNGVQIQTKEKLSFDRDANNSLTIHSSLTTIDQESDTIQYYYRPIGRWQKCFKLNRYHVQYSEPINNVPESILCLPFIGNVLPLTWLFNAKIKCESIDKNFFDYLKYVKNSFADMNKRESWGKSTDIGIIPNSIIENQNDSCDDKWLLLFSGGVDATNSLIDLVELKPAILTIWGSDIFFTDAEKKAWSIVSKDNSDLAKQFNLNYLWCQSFFRLAIDSINPNSWLNKIINSSDNYWHIYQHGLALILHVAPLSFKYNYRYVNIASSYSSKGEIYPCASLPQIDENIRFSSSRVFHNSFGDSRLDKLMKIIDYSEKNNVNFKLRVCWETVTGHNCCCCEKCVRTILPIIMMNKDPKDFGFDIDQSIYPKIMEKIESRKIKINDFYYQTIQKLAPTYNGSDELVLYLCNKCGYTIKR